MRKTTLNLYEAMEANDFSRVNKDTEVDFTVNKATFPLFVMLYKRGASCEELDSVIIYGKRIKALFNKYGIETPLDMDTWFEAIIELTGYDEALRMRDEAEYKVGEIMRIKAEKEAKNR